MNRQYRLVIKTIRDMQGNVYDIFDLEYQVRTIIGLLWKSATVYEALEDALRWYPDVEIIDKRGE